MNSFRKGVCPAGVVRAFDARSGALKWAWNAVPPGETDINLKQDLSAPARRRMMIYL